MKTGFGSEDERNGPLRAFLVLGLPRSRTAWVANWLTWGRVRCEHELCEDARGEEAKQATALIANGVLAQGKLPHCLFAGVADTWASVYVERLAELLSGPRIVVIDRPAEEVCASMRRLGLDGPEEAIAFLKEKLDRAALMPGALVVKYRDLGCECTARAILGHVAPGEHFDRHRWMMLQDFNVQLTRSALRRMTAQE